MKKKNKTEFTPEEIAEIKRIHEDFVARLKELPKQGTVKEEGDDPFVRETIKRWVEDPEAMKRDLNAMGSLE